MDTKTLRLLSMLVLLLSPISAKALTILIKDQNGNPVSNAVVSLISEEEDEVDNLSLPTAIMDQVGKQFVPHVQLIKQGQYVSFPNSDNIRHHVYSFSKPKQFEIKLYADTPENPLLFDQPGIVALGCNIHDSMLGYIFVSPWKNSQITNELGRVVFKNVNEFSEISVWHPKLLRPSEPLIYRELSAINGNIQISIELKQATKPKFKKSRWR